VHFLDEYNKKRTGVCLLRGSNCCCCCCCCCKCVTSVIIVTAAKISWVKL